MESCRSIGKNVVFGHNCIIEANVQIGDNTYIDSNTIVRNGTQIGENSFVGANCIIGEYLMDFCVNSSKYGLVKRDIQNLPLQKNC